MKNILFYVAIVVTYLLLPTFTYATVGGPTLIDSLQYNMANKSEILYEQLNYSGKGCPPEAYSMNLVNGVKRVLISCNDADWMNSTLYNTKLENTLASYPSLLKHIDLTKNNFSAQINITRQQAASEKNGFLNKTDFRLDIFQDNQIKGSFEYSGCDPDQLHIIEGYIIPNINTLVLLVATKGDCFENGYTRETLFTVPNVTLYNQSPLPLKNGNEAESVIGNLSIIANRSISLPPEPKEKEQVLNIQPVQTDNTLTLEIIIGALVMIILALIFRKG